MDKQEMIVRLEWEDELGEDWMNEDNLCLLLYSPLYTERELLQYEILTAQEGEQSMEEARLCHAHGSLTGCTPNCPVLGSSPDCPDWAKLTAQEGEGVEQGREQIIFEVGVEHGRRIQVQEKRDWDEQNRKDLEEATSKAFNTAQEGELCEVCGSLIWHVCPICELGHKTAQEGERCVQCGADLTITLTECPHCAKIQGDK
jgi:hypothetical protein